MGDDIDPCKLSKFGFAKLLGTRGDEPVEYLIRKFEVVLGRNSKNSTADVVLGESMSISRKHAVIRYNFETKCFELIVMGKNGVKVGDAMVLPDQQPRELQSGDCICTAAESCMHFLLPKSTHPYKQSFNGGSGTPILSDASHTVAHASATAAETPASNATIGAGIQPVLAQRSGLAAARMPVGVSPLQSGLHATVDTIMADSPAIGNEPALGLQSLALPILSSGSGLPYGSEAVQGKTTTQHSVGPP